MWLISNRLRRSHSFKAFFSSSAVALLLSVFTNWTFWGDGSSIWACRLPRLKFPSSSWGDPELPFALFKSRSSLSIFILSWSISRFFVARSFDNFVFKSRSSRSSWFCFFFWASSFLGLKFAPQVSGVKNMNGHIQNDIWNFHPVLQHQTKDWFVLASFHFQMLFSLALIFLRGEIILLPFSSVLLFDFQVRSYHESENTPIGSNFSGRTTAGRTTASGPQMVLTEDLKLCWDLTLYWERKRIQQTDVILYRKFYINDVIKKHLFKMCQLIEKIFSFVCQC